MATKVTTTVVKGGKNPTTTTKVKDTSKMSSKQKLKQSKINSKTSMSNNAAKTAVAGEVLTSMTTVATEKERTRREQSKNINRTYQDAIAKWNGIISSMPDNAEGTDVPMPGESLNDSSTGSHPNSGSNSFTWEGN